MAVPQHIHYTFLESFKDYSLYELALIVDVAPKKTWNPGN